MKIRAATQEDARTIARIYNQGIEERIATFETQPRSAREVSAWFDRPYPVIAVEEDGQVVAFAASSEYRPRACYAGVAEFSVYVTRRTPYATRNALRPPEPATVATARRRRYVGKGSRSAKGATCSCTRLATRPADGRGHPVEW